MQFAFDALIPDHDAGVFNPPTTAPGAGGAGAAVDYFLGGLRRWDAVYLLHVAEHGYTYENTLAFLPGVPAVWRLSGASGAQQLLLSAVCVNALCVCVTAVVVRRLAAVVVRDDVVAMRAARLYCVNPAAVFFAAPYTEAIYSLATFTGLLLCEQRQWKWRRLVAASACFAVGGACRSNGLVNVGFVAYAALVDVVGTSSRPGRSRPVARPLLVYAVALLASVALCCLPFVLFQLHAASLYCAGPTPPRSLPARLAAYAVQRGYRTAGEGAPPAWCARWPRFSYASVQSELWGVGALRYYEWRQLPNFLLAAPMACLCVAAAVAFVKTAGVARCVRLDLDHDAARTKKSDDVKPGDRFASQRNFIYIAHLCVLFVFAAIFMHIQVQIQPSLTPRQRCNDSHIFLGIDYCSCTDK